MLINLDCTGLPLDNLSTNAHFKGAVMPEDKNERGFFKGLAMLASMGIAIDELTEEQQKYLSSWEEGT